MKNNFKICVNFLTSLHVPLRLKDIKFHGVKGINFFSDSSAQIDPRSSLLLRFLSRTQTHFMGTTPLDN